ncbi:hypothetical protein V2H45_08980 [Tumidithrix elongata RA019]|uniref:Uncharacterized protein n=1 Tax=Tumidithrix elongata BACA0141 TaxID=2716417 RepID=A0AAW9PVU1_9CYAN|nr:hypothetical protein [Tumidithrix elongata RA019]
MSSGTDDSQGRSAKQPNITFSPDTDLLVWLVGCRQNNEIMSDVINRKLRKLMNMELAERELRNRPIVPSTEDAGEETSIQSDSSDPIQPEIG